MQYSLKLNTLTLIQKPFQLLSYYKKVLSITSTKIRHIIFIYKVIK